MFHLILVGALGLVLGGSLGYALRGAENRFLHEVGDKAKDVVGSIEKKL